MEDELKDDISFMKSIAYLNRNDDFIAREFGNTLIPMKLRCESDHLRSRA